MKAARPSSRGRSLHIDPKEYLNICQKYEKVRLRRAIFTYIWGLIVEMEGNFALNPIITIISGPIEK